jgi:hypothetical protein
MNIRIELSEQDLQRLVAQYIEEQTGQTVKQEQICIEVKSKQNYKAEWEVAAYRAVYQDIKL